MITKFENENQEEKTFLKENTSQEHWTESLFLSIYQKPCIRFHLKTYHYLKSI